MRCFVTGASGKLGGALVDELMARHHFVTALVRSQEEAAKLPTGVEAVIGDINDKAAVEKGVGLNQVVFHLAALVDYSVNWDTLERVNIKGTRTVADACAKNGAKLIFASSTGVYGKKPLETPTNEKTPTNPSDLYAKSKLEAERIIGEYHGVVPYVIFRIGVLYGPPYFDVYARVLKKIENGSMQVLGKGDNVVSFVHCADVIEAMIAAAKFDIKAGMFILSENSTLTQEMIYKTAAEALGVEFKPSHIEPGLAKALISLMSIVKKSSIGPEDINILSSHRIFDTSKAENVLGWKPKISLTEGIRQMVSMYRERKEKIARIQEIRRMRELKAQGKLPEQTQPEQTQQVGQPGQNQQTGQSQQAEQTGQNQLTASQETPKTQAQQPAQEQTQRKQTSAQKQANETQEKKDGKENGISMI